MPSYGLKTTEEHVVSAAKYVSTAAGVAWAITDILIFAQPDWNAISEPIQALLTVLLNLVLVYWAKRG